MKHFSHSSTSEKSILSHDLGFHQLAQNLAKIHTKKILKMTDAITKFAAEEKEEEKLIILIDIAGFSKDSTREQVYKIYLFERFLMTQILGNSVNFSGKIKINHFVPTGDGCYIVAKKCSQEIALDFLLSLVSGFKNIQTENGQPLSLRASALIGKVVPFIDMARHINYIGEGMNEASRILSGGQKALEEDFLSKNPAARNKEEKNFSHNSIYIGDSLANNIEEYKEVCAQIFKFSDVADKHEKKRNITVLQGII